MEMVPSYLHTLVTRKLKQAKVSRDAECVGRNVDRVCKVEMQTECVGTNVGRVCR